MKIGLTLFGHLRSSRSAHDSYKGFLNTLQQVGDVDVFCHTWDIEESVTASWWKEHKPGDTPPPNVNANEIEERYHPVRYIIESTKQFDEGEYAIKTSIPISGTLSMLYTQQQSFQLLKQYESVNNFQYDVIVKTRYDLLFEIDPCFTDLVKGCAANKIIYLPSSNPYELIGSCSDIFAVGHRDEMETYFSFCDNFKKAIEIYKSKGYEQFVPEFCMTVYLDSNNINRKELTGLRLHILRMNGHKFQINSEKHFEANEPLCFYSESIKTNKDILADNNEIIKNNSYNLAKKYASWIANDASGETYGYAEFYCGKWIPVSKIKQLATKVRGNKIFKSSVMRNFFEEAMRNGSYSNSKKLLLAFILMLYSGYGFFFFRVWKNIMSNNY